MIAGEDPVITASSSDATNKTDTTHYETDESDEDDSDDKPANDAETTFYESQLPGVVSPGTSTAL